MSAAQPSPYVSFEEVKARFEAEQQKRAAMPTWRRVLYDTPRALTVVVPREIGNLRFRLRVRANRALRGWDSCDWWEYASNNSRRAVVLLKKLRDNGHTFKCMKNHDDEGVDPGACWDECPPLWAAAMDDMIFFHEVVADDYEEADEIPERGSPLYHALRKTGHNFKTEDDARRYRRGKYYYAKYYEGLWD